MEATRGAGPEAILSLHLQGRYAKDGALPIGELRDVLTHLDKLLKHIVAEETKAQPGMVTRDEKKPLFMIRLSEGSAVLDVLPEATQRRLTSQRQEFDRRVGRRAYEGLKGLASKRPEERSLTDEELLSHWANVVESIPSYQEVTVRAPATPHAKPLKVDARLRKALSRQGPPPPKKVFREVVGKVHGMRDTKDRFWLETADGVEIQAAWDERFRGILSDAFKAKQWVRARGVATFQPPDPRPKEIVVTHIEPLSEAEAREQAHAPSVTPKQALRALVGVLESDLSGIAAREALERARREAWGGG